ncbi:MAG: class I SAM-dependent methyltransferase [Synechococcus sp.]
MAGEPIRFTDGAAYDRFMGVWSRLVGQEFLHGWRRVQTCAGWMWAAATAPSPSWWRSSAARRRWRGVDPSEEQLAYARLLPALGSARLQSGDAMALPYGADGFELAVMPLVIFFVPDPPRGVAEMARVVAPGGTVAAYAWDMANGGFPYQDVRDILEELGHATPMPPSVDASRLEALQALWDAAGLERIKTTQIPVERSFPGFEELWGILLQGPSAGQVVATLSKPDQERVRERLQERWRVRGEEPVTLQARANAIRGEVPGRTA